MAHLLTERALKSRASQSFSALNHRATPRLYRPRPVIANVTVAGRRSHPGRHVGTSWSGGGPTSCPATSRRTRPFGRLADNASAHLVLQPRPSYSTRATPFPGLGNLTNTSGSCPGTISRGLVA